GRLEAGASPAFTHACRENEMLHEKDIRNLIQSLAERPGHRPDPSRWRCRASCSELTPSSRRAVERPPLAGRRRAVDRRDDQTARSRGRGGWLTSTHWPGGYGLFFLRRRRAGAALQEHLGADRTMRRRAAMSTLLDVLAGSTRRAAPRSH